MEDIKVIKWLAPVQSCSTAGTSRTLIQLGVIFVTPNVWVSVTATYFKNEPMNILAEAFGVDCQFVWTYFAGTIGMIEWFNKEIIRTAKAISRKAG